MITPLSTQLRMIAAEHSTGICAPTRGHIALRQTATHVARDASMLSTSWEATGWNHAAAAPELKRERKWHAAAVVGPTTTRGGRRTCQWENVSYAPSMIAV
jgi:hypothetical protein